MTPTTARRSRARRAADAILRSPLADMLTAPHGIDRYLELVDPLLAGDETRATVTDVRRETPDTTTLTLRPNRWVGHVAGQHVVLGVEIDGVRRTRCYSVSSSAHRDDGQFTVTVKAKDDGVVSHHLQQVRPGTVVALTPAAGDFVLPDPRPDRILLISGGSGITPVMSMLRTLVEEDAEARITFLHYARTDADVPFADELREVAARHDNVDVTVVRTRDPDANDHPLRGHLCREHLDAVVGDLTDVPAYVCGPAGLVETAEAIFAEADHADALHVERFELAGSTTSDPDARGDLRFASAGVTVVNDGRTVLEQAEAAGLTPQSGCRMGICHTCVRPKLAGRVRDVRDDHVSTADPEDVQLCVSVPVGDVEIDC